jgi:hypothetical protein
MCFQVPQGKWYWRAYNVNGPPENEAEAMDLLAKAWKHMHHNWWYQYGNMLMLYPPPPNDGETLVIVVDDS